MAYRRTRIDHPIFSSFGAAMIYRLRQVLDIGFLIGLVFALFLAGKIVPYLIVVGVIPIAVFWQKSDYVRPSSELKRFLLPTLGYFAFSLCLLYAYPGLPPGEKPPGNPNLELYAVALALLAVGFLRGQQIRHISRLFHAVVPPSLLAAFAVLSAYMFLGIDRCRVRVEAAWPFIPAVIFATLTFLLLLGWATRPRWQRYMRLVFVALSIVVSLAYTGSRGVAVGQFAVLAGFMLLQGLPKFRSGLPTFKEFSISIAAGLALSILVADVTGCGSLSRWPALLDVIKNAQLTEFVTPAQAAPVAPSVTAGHQIPKAVTDLSTDASINLRLDMWRASLEAIRQAPIFGHGALSLRPIIQNRFGFEHNHNQYLAWLVTGGIVFLAMGLLFMLTPVFVSKGMAAADRAVIILSVTGLWGGSMMFDAFLNLDFYLHYFSLLLGVLFALTADAKEKQGS